MIPPKITVTKPTPGKESLSLEEAEAYVREAAPRLKKVFRLEDWDVRIRVYGRQATDPEDAQGTCYTDQKCLYASISIYVEEITNIDDLAEAFVHEFLHIVIGTFDTLLDAGIIGEGRTERHMFTIANETTVVRLINILRFLGMTPNVLCESDYTMVSPVNITHPPEIDGSATRT